MRLTEFIFFKDTPFNDFVNTVHFQSNEERDEFFKNNYSKYDFTNKGFNFVKDRLVVDIPTNYLLFSNGFNYCTFKSQDPDYPTRYYAFVMKTEYMNDNVTRAYLVIDAIMTFTQGNVLNRLTNINLKRAHLSQYRYDNYLPLIQNNNDVLEAKTKRYQKSRSHYFRNFSVVITSSADLESDFGEQDSPLLKTSNGQTYDRITSPLNLYVCTMTEYKSVNSILSDYPWIAQNVTQCLLIPTEFLDEDDLEPTDPKISALNVLKKFKDDARSQNYFLDSFTFTYDELVDMFMLTEDEKHLMRSEYCSIEMYSWDGQRVIIEPQLLKEETGLQIQAVTNVGYNNQVSMFPLDYMSQGDQNIVADDDEIVMWGGSFLNNAINYTNFDDLPMVIDNYKLSLAESANQRNLSEDRQVSNRIGTVFDSNASLKDRFFNAVSLLSNISITDMFGKFNDEYEFYRDQKAEFADKAISAPSISTQGHSNSFQIANNFFGVTLKFIYPDLFEMQNIKRYYALNGFELNLNGTVIGDLDSMSICNYVQFSGNWRIPNVDMGFIEQMRAQFENGVRMWKADGTNNPMAQNVLDNKIIV